MLQRVRVIAAYFLFIYSVSTSMAFGETMLDPQQWLSHFNQIVVKNDIGDLKKTIITLPTRDISADTLTYVFNGMEAETNGRTPQSAKIIQTTVFGDSIFRGITIINYSNNRPNFLLFDFLKGDSGWLLTDISFSTDFNKLLSWPWPYH